MTELTQRFDACGFSLTEWKDGYTPDEVEEVLEYLQLSLRAMQIEGELVMVWDHLDITGKLPAGNSEVWILSYLSDGYVGAPISTPFIASEALQNFLQGVIDFSEGTLELRPVTFERISRFNVILNH